MADVTVTLPDPAKVVARAKAKWAERSGVPWAQGYSDVRARFLQAAWEEMIAASAVRAAFRAGHKPPPAEGVCP